MNKVLPIFLTLSLLVAITPLQVKAAPQIVNVTDNKAIYLNSNIPKYSKFEIKFEVNNTTAGNMFLPFEANLPNGLSNNDDRVRGISVDAIFSQDNFITSFKTPGFYTQEYEYKNADGSFIVKDGKTWRYPTGKYNWYIRFAPNKIGSWKYKIIAKDSSGYAESPIYTFNVTESTNKGFLKVSSRDTRYFEFDDGSPFFQHGIHSYVGRNNLTTEYKTYKENKINFVREWWSGNYGSAWGEWVLGNGYIGYLPKTMLMPITKPGTTNEILTTYMDYNSSNDSDPNNNGTDGWFDACIVTDTQDNAILQNKLYKYEITYMTSGITGPRIAGKPHGLVGKIDNGGNSWICWESGNGQVITNYGLSENNFSTISGTFNSGTRNFMPRVMVGLENVNNGAAYIYKISVREDLGNGNLGPELMGQSSSDFHLNLFESRLLDGDLRLEEAQKNDVYIKIVLFEKEDKIFKKIKNEGGLTLDSPDNAWGFYGINRTENMTRFLQAAWMRYVQARWGYSTSIHSFELINEGDPGNSNHFALTDEMGKYFRCRVFGITVPFTDGAKCTYEHPNSHLTTTSFWHSFPMNFWAGANYPNVSYADIHAYISTSTIDCDKPTAQNDSAYYHNCHSVNLNTWGKNSGLNKPIVRGEAGMDSSTTQGQYVLGLEPRKEKLSNGTFGPLQGDQQGVWLKTYLWATLNSGALYELYWWYGEHINNLNREWWNNGKLYVGTKDLTYINKNFSKFTENIPLNNGFYKDINAINTNAKIQIFGQKDSINGNAHFWIRNANYTWSNVVNNVYRAAESGSISIAGFTINKTYKLEIWDTNTGLVKNTQNVVADSTGNITLSINNLLDDTAYKIINTDQVVPSPTPTLNPSPTPNPSINPIFDVNKDGTVNLLDVIAILAEIFK